MADKGEHGERQELTPKERALRRIGKNLYRARAYLDLTQEAVAKAVGASTNAYRSYEDGRHPMPYEVLFRLPDVLRRPVPYFLGVEESCNLSDEERALVDVYRSIRSPEVREAVRRMVSVLVATDREPVQR